MCLRIGPSQNAGSILKRHVWSELQFEKILSMVQAQGGIILKGVENGAALASLRPSFIHVGV